MTTKTIWYIGFFALAVAACNKSESNPETDGLDAFNKDSLAARIKILASDEFQGRRPFTAGEEKTVHYLEQSFKSLGLEPGNGDSYVQDVPLVEINPKRDPIMMAQSRKGKVKLKNSEDYVLTTEDTTSTVSLENDEIIFVGFGVVAPEYGWNDYQGLDVKGKVVLVRVNDPGYDQNDSSLFKGTRMTYYGRWTYKYEEAARQGAKACIIIHNTAAASYPFSVVQNSWGTARLTLVRDPKDYRCPIEGWISEQAAKRLFTISEVDTTVLSQANKKRFKPVPLGVKLSTSLHVTSKFDQSKNVIAKITGTKRPDEYIIYTAHWDHFGIGKPDASGDSIYNGASDNASGTASILEIARAFKSMKNKPERSIIFLSVTAEEQGLLGSAYYAQHPIYPLDKTVANINIDVINNWGRTRDIGITGAGQSDLEDYLRQEVSKAGRYIGPESHPEAGHYFRSDHFNFAKVGVPALTTDSGLDDLEKGKTYGQQKHDEYTEKYYHQPSDEYNAGQWNLDGGLEDIELLFKVGRKLAFETSWPQWKENSEFKTLRKK
jgi:Zn-dependent M28 family amino/carboxypeptidase